MGPCRLLVLNKAEAPVQFGVLLNFDRRGDVCEWHEHPLQNKGSVEQKSVFDWYRHSEHEEFHQRDVALYTSTPNTSTHLFGGRPPRLAASVKDAPSEKALALCDCKTRGGHKGIQTRKKNPPSLSMLHASYSSFDDTICVHSIHTLRLWRRVSAIFQPSILEGRCPSALQNKFRHCRDRGIVEDQSHRQLNTRQRLRELLENGKAGDVRGCVGRRQKLEIPKSPETANSSSKS